MNSPFATVAIPCRNAARWIAHAVASVEAPDVEILVVDDGSNDGSAEILRGFGSGITLLSGGGRGAPAARNAAWRRARGEWVQFLDADDYLLTGKIARQLGEAGDRAGDSDVLYGPVIAETWRGDKAISRAVLEIDAATDLCEQFISWQLPQTGGALWRRAFLDRLDGWREDQPCCQEHELYLRGIRAGGRFVRTESALAVYRLWSEETLCRRDPLLAVRERTRLIESLLEWLRETGRLEEKYRRVAGRAFFEMARTMARYDLRAAGAYHAGWKRRGLIVPEGPAAPATFRAIYRTLGFTCAERVARLLRPSGGEDAAQSG